MRLQFDDLTFDSETRQVSSGGKEVRLSLKTFDLLAFLIEHRPRAVSKANIHKTSGLTRSSPTVVVAWKLHACEHMRPPRLIGHCLEALRFPEVFLRFFSSVVDLAILPGAGRRAIG
jgi:hypothetical protein